MLTLYYCRGFCEFSQIIRLFDFVVLLFFFFVFSYVVSLSSPTSTKEYSVACLTTYTYLHLYLSSPSASGMQMEPRYAQDKQRSKDCKNSHNSPSALSSMIVLVDTAQRYERGGDPGANWDWSGEDGGGKGRQVVACYVDFLLAVHWALVTTRGERDYFGNMKFKNAVVYADPNSALLFGCCWALHGDWNYNDRERWRSFMHTQGGAADEEKDGDQEETRPWWGGAEQGSSKLSVGDYGKINTEIEDWRKTIIIYYCFISSSSPALANPLQCPYSTATKATRGQTSYGFLIKWLKYIFQNDLHWSDQFDHRHSHGLAL